MNAPLQRTASSRFSTLEAAEAWGRERGAKELGTRHWWGTVKDIESTYTVWEFEVLDGASDHVSADSGGSAATKKNGL